MSCTRKVGMLSVGPVGPVAIGSVGPVCPVAIGSVGPVCPVTIGSVGSVRDSHLVIISKCFDFSYKRKTVFNDVEFSKRNCIYYNKGHILVT